MMDEALSSAQVMVKEYEMQISTLQAKCNGKDAILQRMEMKAMDEEKRAKELQIKLMDSESRLNVMNKKMNEQKVDVAEQVIIGTYSLKLKENSLTIIHSV